MHMQQTFKTFEDLISHASDYLSNKLAKKKNTVYYHVLVWRKVKRYMDFQKIEHFSSAVGKEYIEKKISNRPNKELSRSEQYFVHAVKVLCQFYDTGVIQPRKKLLFFEGAIGQLMTEYISYKMTQRLKLQTIEWHKQCLYRFLIFLNNAGIASVKSLTPTHLINYIKGLDPARVGLSRVILTNLRDFLRYLYHLGQTDVDLSQFIPTFNRRTPQPLPSAYTQAEIEQLIGVIDRGTKPGKRDYVILLLAARVGLRASDIAGLKFENINWDKCTLTLTQFKTGRPLELPLLPEIGNALIDYLKYSRPQSGEPYLFLLCRKPYSRLYPYSVGQMVQSYFLQAGVNTESRKHGAHALRHSLAVNMLEKGTTLPVISEVLGHEYTSSTEYYLRVDRTTMRKCVLEVPAVSPAFYNQKGGLFYAY